MRECVCVRERALMLAAFLCNLRAIRYALQVRATRVGLRECERVKGKERGRVGERESEREYVRQREKKRDGWGDRAKRYALQVI